MYEEHHHHHEHAEHAHEEEAKAESDDLAKLRILLPHWIEHNEDHAASFERWVAKARALGREERAQGIEEAVERMAACNQALRAALEALEGG
jgi:L-ascorbate metabolism protein UlaG (beta-lactamase superfamily)